MVSGAFSPIVVIRKGTGSFVWVFRATGVGWSGRIAIFILLSILFRLFRMRPTSLLSRSSIVFVFRA